MREYIKNTLLSQAENLEKLAKSEAFVTEVERAAVCQVEALKSGHKILMAGNGGSAADAQHFAAELVGRYLKERRGLPAIAFTTDSSILTSVANDYSYEYVFARQVEALAQEGDVFVGISTSGNSKNVIEAVKAAKQMGVRTIGMTGRDGGEMAGMCDILINIPNNVTARVQESHEVAIHMMCQMIEEALFD